ncbi:MAG: hypothetical protein E4H03_04430 [Myxococcales bacterium]|nr:MAG: hypothetical protein E4H03_04430 [Myxococcales bacterium]
MSKRSGNRFTPASRLSTWRRIALQLWDDPRDPTVYGNLEINMTRALEYLEVLSRETGKKVTVTHLVTKAIARALAAHPEANAIITGRRIYMRQSIDVYCQVATDSGRDLSGVKVTDVEHKSVAEIAATLAQSIRNVRSGDDGSEGTKKAVLTAPGFVLGPLMALVDYASYRYRSIWGASASGTTSSDRPWCRTSASSAWITAWRPWCRAPTSRSFFSSGASCPDRSWSTAAWRPHPA